MSLLKGFKAGVKDSLSRLRPKKPRKREMGEAIRPSITRKKRRFLGKRSLRLWFKGGPISRAQKRPRRRSIAPRGR